MADTSYGYPGSVNAAALATWLPNVAAAQYCVNGPVSGRVIKNTTGDRGVTVLPGSLIGDGIYDIFNTGVNLNLASVSSGSRWDMIVLRRTWSSKTSIYTIIQGSATKGLPARNNNKGVLTDQPIALCRVQAGSSTVQEIVDLRVWAHNGGCVANDELVKNYLDEPGTVLNINEDVWVKVITTTESSNSSSWMKLAGYGQLSLWGRGSQSKGNSTTPSDLGNAFLVQSGQSLVTTDANAFGRVFWPKQFPNGLLTCFFQPADDTQFNDLNICIAGSSWGTRPANEVYAAFRIYGARNGVRSNDWPNKQIRCNWLAIGY